MSSTETGCKPRALVLAATVLALGLVLAAFLLGYQTKGIGSGRSTVAVKGLAEKPVKADSAEWSVNAEARGNTFAEALENVRQEKKKLEAFLLAQGFSAEMLKVGDENVQPHYEMEQRENKQGDFVEHQVQKGFEASQTITVSTQQLDLVNKAYRAALDYKAQGASIGYSRPKYLVSGLEIIKMSLIADATQNARTRAQEFVKQGDSSLGAIRSASQGAFYILPETGADSNSSEYGGVYDTSTIEKRARVVVTIEFNLQ